jgi:hypothetical protein
MSRYKLYDYGDFEISRDTFSEKYIALKDGQVAHESLTEKQLITNIDNAEKRMGKAKVKGIFPIECWFMNYSETPTKAQITSFNTDDKTAWITRRSGKETKREKRGNYSGGIGCYTINTETTRLAGELVELDNKLAELDKQRFEITSRLKEYAITKESLAKLMEE